MITTGSRATPPGFGWILCAISVVVVAQGTGGSIFANETWTYRAELSGARPVPRVVGLADERPEDLQIEPDYRGVRRRYAQLRYGSENSRRVIVVIDELSADEFDLYVDVDRDRIVQSHERITGSGREWQLNLPAEIVREDFVEQYPRQVALRLAATGDRLSVATLGGVAGTISIIDPRTREAVRRTAQRIDGDANGLFADSRDRLRVDLNGDEKFDAVTEQFIWLPVLTLSGRRYAVKADRPGESLSLEEITGTGQLQIAVARLPERAKIIAFEGMVFSDDGSAWSLKEAHKPQEVPVGRYALGSVTLTIDTGEREPWHFVFSRSEPVRAQDWVEVTANSQVSLEAVGETQFVLNAGETARPGDFLAVSPRLYTHDGLLVNLSCRGKQIGSFDNARSHNPCEIRLVSAGGKTLSAARSGFA